MLIDKEDAIKAVCEACYMYKYICEHYKDCKYYPCDDVTALEAVPEAPSGDLISKQRVINILRSICGSVCTINNDVVNEINALPSAENSNAKTQNSNHGTQKSNGDLIYRADAIDAVQKKMQDWGSYAFEDYRRGLYEAQDIIEALPSAEAVQGEWIDIDNYYRMATCSHCHKVTMFEKWGEYTKPYDFCPNCGARMYKGGDSE